MANPLAEVTLTANIVATFVLDASYDRVEVLNVNGVAAVYFNVEGVTPVVGAAGCHVLPAAIGALEVGLRDRAATVKCISTGIPIVAVRGIDNF